MSARGRWKSYAEVRAWARTMGITSHSAWIRTPRPAWIPSHPEMVYADQWPGWAEFLGRPAKLVSFEAAQAWGQAQGLKNGEDWKRAVRPAGIPYAPHKVYADRWAGWRDFLGMNWASFDEARRWARQQGMRGLAEWCERSTSGGLREDMPSNPHKTYKNKGWTNWRDFLGTYNVAPKDRQFLTYDQALAWVREQPEIIDLSTWKSGQKPENLPHNPSTFYRSKGWLSWEAFTGRKCPLRVRMNLDNFPALEALRQYCLDHHIVTRDQWLDHHRNGELPPGYPRLPSNHPDYVNWSSFLGRERQWGSSMIERIVAFEVGTFLRLDESINRVPVGNGKFKRADMVCPDVRLLIEYDGIRWHRDAYDKDVAETKLLRKAGWTVVRVREAPLPLVHHRMDVSVPSRGRPFNTTVRVIHHLAKRGFLGDGGDRLAQDYEDHGQLRSKGKNIASMHWATFEEAQVFARALKLKNRKEWMAYTQRPDFPVNMPRTPEFVYAYRFTTYTDFLATGYTPKKFLNYDDARTWAFDHSIRTQTAWFSTKKPTNIPSHPERSYAGKGWMGWTAFFHTPLGPNFTELNSR